MSIKILLADDSITIQKVIGIIFGGEDYALTVVDNGKAAVEKAQEISPDILLIDALMPGMSGYEVCEAVRSIPALASKPVLLLTGSFEPFDEAKAKSCGADDFLSKPFESQQIVSKVKELYEQGLSRATTPSQPEKILEPATMDIPKETPSQSQVAESTGEVANADDIWAAFSTEPEAMPLSDASSQSSISESALEPDIFSIIGEEPESLIAEPKTTNTTPVSSSASQWIPVEEQTYEFTEESIAELPTNALSENAPTMTEVAFGEVCFEEVAIDAASAPDPPIAEPPIFEMPVSPAFEEPVPSFTETIIPAFTEPEAPPFTAPGADYSELSAPITQTGVTASPATLTEEQLRAAIAGVSQDVIQRIVWEVVPDLAEILIKEAIQKIKAGL